MNGTMKFEEANEKEANKQIGCVYLAFTARFQQKSISIHHTNCEQLW
jgi:hypothetical protein